MRLFLPQSHKERERMSVSSDSGVLTHLWALLLFFMFYILTKIKVKTMKIN